MKRLSKHTIVLVLLILLVAHLAIINDYGFTWDFHFHFFGGGHLLGMNPQELEPRNLPYVEPDPRRAVTLPYGALMSIPPVVSYLLFYKTWNILPSDAAYHLPIIIWGVAGIGILYAFMKEAFSKRIALFSALCIGLMPRYFGDLHNNMKDIPSAVAFTLNIWLLWRLMRYKRVFDLFLAVIAFAIAFNVKINAIFIPIVFAIWLVLQKITNTMHQASNFQKSVVFSLDALKLRFVWNLGFEIWYFVFAPIAAFALWSLVWPDPIAQLFHAYRTFGVGTNNIEVILENRWYCSGSTVPWYYPWWYLGITTPLSVLVFFLLGVFSVYTLKTPNIKRQASNKSHIPIAKRLNSSSFGISKLFGTWNLVLGNSHSGTLLLLWLIVPLARYLIPSIGVIDGIRHFEEALFPIAALAAVGFDRLLSFARPGLAKLITLITLISLVFPIVSYHPYQIAYFNELVAGAAGAFGRYDLDYWGTSQKEAVQWVNKHAPKNAYVHIVMEAAVAGQYLRTDLLSNLNKYGYDDSDFVIFLNRQSFLYRFYYAYEYLLHHSPAYTVSIKDAPLTWVYDNRTDNKTPRQSPWWQDEDPCIIKYWRGERP